MPEVLCLGSPCLSLRSCCSPACALLAPLLTLTHCTPGRLFSQHQLHTFCTTLPAVRPSPSASCLGPRRGATPTGSCSHLPGLREIPQSHHWVSGWGCPANLHDGEKGCPSARWLNGSLAFPLCGNCMPQGQASGKQESRAFLASAWRGTAQPGHAPPCLPLHHQPVCSEDCPWVPLCSATQATLRLPNCKQHSVPLNGQVPKELLHPLVEPLLRTA